MSFSQLLTLVWNRVSEKSRVTAIWYIQQGLWNVIRFDFFCGEVLFCFHIPRRLTLQKGVDEQRIISVFYLCASRTAGRIKEQTTSQNMIMNALPTLLCQLSDLARQKPPNTAFNTAQGRKSQYNLQVKILSYLSCQICSNIFSGWAPSS